MKPWVEKQTSLAGQSVKLLPLQEAHFDELAHIARDERIWKFYAMNCANRDTLIHELTDALLEREKGTQFPFVIFHNELQKVIGSTRFLLMQPAHRKLEIGWTWLRPDHWATEVNAECKLLLLTFCFEELMTIRVQLKTDENNIRSRRAIEKIGSQFEGILRNDMIRENNTYRNSAYYSVIESEWPSVKERLVNLYWSQKSRAKQLVVP